jgi:deoxycytidine triphosphate deaminase
MNFIGIIISGTRGSGKTAITRKLCEQFPIFEQCKSVTTRERRPDDKDEYDYIPDSDFIEYRTQGKLITDVDYGGIKYGILSNSVQTIFDAKKIPLLVVAPECVKSLNNNEQRFNRQYLSFFVDTDDTILESRLQARQHFEKVLEDTQRKDDRNYESDIHYSIKNNGDLKDIVDLIQYIWEYRNSGGLLPKKAINLMIKGGLLLINADLNKVQGASYDLRLGDDYCQNGEIQTLSPTKSIIVLEPGNYAIVSSLEIANFPKDIAGRYDLTVGNFIKGIILSNGPQVDPGFSGALLCTLFNSSNKDVSLRRGDKFASIEFIKLIEPTLPYSGQYQNKAALWEYIKEKSSSGVIFNLRIEIKSLQNEINALKNEKWYIKILPLVISLLALMIAIYKLLQP